MMNDEGQIRAPPPRAGRNGGPPGTIAAESARRRPAGDKSASDHLVDGRYSMLARLGSGRLGPIYEAADGLTRDSGIERHVAIQLLDASVIAGRRFTGEFERGVKSLQAIWHPNIVKLLDAGRDGGHYYLVMELPDSASLRFVLDDVGKLPLEETIAVIGSLGDALQYLHAKSIVHGDLKPENVLVTFDYEVKLLDVVPPEWTAAAPEGPDEQDDVYGLACLAYEMLAGKHPYNANTPEEAHRAGLKLMPIGLLSTSQWRALAAALELQRENRTPNLARFLDEFGINGVEKLRELVAADAESPAAAAAAPAFTPDPEPAPVYSRLNTDVLLPVRALPDEPRRSGAGAKLLLLVLVVALALTYVYRDPLGTEINAYIESFDAALPKDAPSEPVAAVENDPQETAGMTNAAPGEESALVAAPAKVPETDAASAVPAPLTTQPAEVPVVTAAPAEPAPSGPQKFGFARSPVSVAENEVAARIVIQRTGDTSRVGSIAWWTEEGSAIAGRDFADLGRRIEKFAAGEKLRTVFVPLVNDTAAEPAKSFNVYLGSDSGRRGANEPLSGMRVVIVDDD